jgi:hypothetical protein
VEAGPRFSDASMFNVGGFNVGGFNVGGLNIVGPNGIDLVNLTETLIF